VSDRFFRGAQVAAVTASWVSGAIFGAYIIAFYGGTLASGQVEIWNRTLPRLYEPQTAAATVAIGVHFATGGILLLLGPLQLVAAIRARWPAFHRWVGRVYVLAAALVGAGGLAFILLKGTIGGTPMNVGFGLYGALVVVAAVQTYRFGRARALASHRAWAIRLWALAIGSWLYRMDYGFWLLLTNWAGHTRGFDGPFDVVMAFFFYVPNLVIAELVIRAGQRPWRRALRTVTAVALVAAALLVGAATFFFTKLGWGPGIAIGLGLASADPEPGPEPAPPPAVGVPAAVADAAVPDAALADDPRRWLAGDLHVHVAPPDTDREVTGTLAQIAASATTSGLDFVVLTPHLRVSAWTDRARRAKRREAWRAFAADARARSAPTMIPAAEWTTPEGHFTVLGVDLAAIDDADLLGAAHAAGAFVSVNHPFAVPTRIPGFGVSELDMSYRVWSEHAAGFTAVDGAEVWNVPLSLANVFSAPGGRTGEDRAWSELDRIARGERRRVVALGGTDNHRGQTMATTWVLATDASEAAITSALRAGATCVGGPDGGSFRAHGGDGAWVRIGGAVTGSTVTLAWDGSARLFIDDVDQGEHAGGFVHAAGDAVHTYRIVVATSRCGFIYANL
jgi:hypothetical protein